jgi:hypothetical protein
MQSAVKREALSSVFGMALLFGGCPKRQTTPRLVYVPAPPPAAAAGQETTETMVIEEPAPPEPVQVTPQPLPAPKPARRSRRIIRTGPPDSTPAETPEAEEPPTTEVPALEPRENPEQENALRNQITGMRQNLQRRIDRLGRQQLFTADRKTLEDAKVFLAQSGRALEQGDLQRSLMLARKASLLVSALEQ